MPHTIPDNFLGLPDKHADYATARFVVLPMPYDATTSFGSGARYGPRAVITASQQVELYDERLGRESYQAGVATHEPLEPDTSGPEATLKNVFAAAKRIVADGKFLFGLGGEHSLTAPLVRAVKARHRDVSVLQIDAHADLRDAYQGSPHSHACVMRRVHDMKVPAIGVGIRNYSKDEARFIQQAGKPIFSALACRESKTWINSVLGALTDEVYVTIDIDGFDPAYAPATGTPEPGGLDWYQVTDLLAAVASRKRIVAADVVEVAPQPPNTVTEFLAAKLMYRLIGLVTAA